MDYVIAIISGLLLGSLVAAAKHLLIWRPFALGRSNRVYWRLALSSALNVLTLLLVFLVRNIWPYSFYFTIAATAVALATVGRWLAIKQ